MANSPNAPSSTDVTAVLVSAAEHDPASIRRVVLSGNYGDVWLRMRPLTDVGLVQIELFDETGTPRIDPALVSALAAEDRHATFVHMKRAAGQAMLHAFVGARELDGWVGPPDELDARLEKAVGHSLAAIVAGDDGSRVHPAIAATGTIALVRGRALAAPAGLPIGLGSFSFHDRFATALAKPGAGAPVAVSVSGAEDDPVGEAPDQAADEATSQPARDDNPSDRIAVIAFDGAALRSAWTELPGVELAARIRTLPERVLGPLAGTRDAVVAELAAIGDRSPEAAGLHSVRALELVLLSEACLFSGGDDATYIDERLLPMFSLTTGDAPFDDPDEAEELESRKSVLEAMVEVLPYRSPEGAMLEQLEDQELTPLPAWVRPGEEHVGSIFLLEPERVRKLLASVDHRDLAARVDRFYRAWWKAQTDDPAGPAFDAWRKQMDERGSPDIQRFFTNWTEWRLVLELAAMNRLSTALLFYSSI